MNKQITLIATMLLLIANFLFCTPASAQRIAAGHSFGIALCNDSIANSWGENTNGQLGDSTLINRPDPVPVYGITGIIAIAGGASHTVALRSDSTVWAWGSNAHGQLGDSTTTQRLSAVQVTGLSGIIAISSGGQHSLALKSDGTVWAWGYNWKGQLGDNTITDRLTPVQVHDSSNTAFLSGIVAIAGGDNHSIALQNDGTIWAWGHNQYGKLGDGTNNDRWLPVHVHDSADVGFLFNVIAIATSEYANHTLALKSDSTVWAWGYNLKGQLGNGTANNNINPLPMPIDTVGIGGGFIAIACGGNHSLALKNDGMVWAWGWNNNGQLGDSSTLDKHSAVKVKPNFGGGIISIAAGYYHSLALKNDNTVWAWGEDALGQLGNGAGGNSTTPILTNSCLSTAIEEISGNLSLTVIPNPSNGNFIVENHKKYQSMRLNICNIMGEKIYQSEITNAKSEINISGQPNGIYFLTLSNSQTLVTWKIVIQH